MPGTYVPSKKTKRHYGGNRLYSARCHYICYSHLCQANFTGTTTAAAGTTSTGATEGPLLYRGNAIHHALLYYSWHTYSHEIIHILSIFFFQFLGETESSSSEGPH